MRQASIQTLTVALQELREHTFSAFACYQRANKLLIPLAVGLNPPLWELGQMLSYYLSLFKMSETSSILLVMIGLISLVDMLSAKTRRMLS